MRGLLARVLGPALLLMACSESVVILEPTDAGADEPDAHPPAADAETELVPGSAFTLAASGYTCAADDAGLLCWGMDDDGGLPLPGQGGPESPRRAASSSAYVQLCSAELHSCGLRKDGEIECWGENEHGQLGLGHVAPAPEPTALRAGLSFVSVACGGRASCAVADTGNLYCWGDNSEGLPAQDDAYGSPDVLTPSAVALSVAVRQVSVGQGHACAVAINGALYCWGRNTDSQLGIGPSPIQRRVPTASDPGVRYHHAAAGQQHSCAVRSDGTVACWGRELAGRLGIGELQDGKTMPAKQVGSYTDYVSVSAHWFHSCARRLSGKLVCWGRNEEGQLGVGDFGKRNTPTAVAGPNAWSAYGVGRFHTCGISEGQVYCWGTNENGALGLAAPERRTEPARVPLEDAR